MLLLFVVHCPLSLKVTSTNTATPHFRSVSTNWLALRTRDEFLPEQMGCALLGLSAAGSGFLGAHMTASIGGADMPVVRIACPRKKAHVRNDAPEGKGWGESRGWAVK